jgi:hypothetical protein
MNPFPTALHVSNDSAGGVRVCVTGCPAKAGPAPTNVNVARLPATITGPLISLMMVRDRTMPNPSFLSDSLDVKADDADCAGWFTPRRHRGI